MEKQFIGKEMKVVHRHMEKYSASLSIKSVKTKIATEYHFFKLTKMLKGDSECSENSPLICC